MKVPRGRRGGEINYLVLTFAELDQEVARCAAGFRQRGLQRGDRALVMVRPGLPLIVSVFALFSLAAVPVVVDPGMGLRSFLTCVRQSQPRVLVGIPLAQWLSRLARRAFKTVQVRIPVPGAMTARARPVRPAEPNSLAEVLVETQPDETAAVLFTSGSTGAPKGVVYTHGMFDAQVGLIRETYGIEPGEVDLPLLPIFALFNPALGMTTIVPEIDPRRPATVDAAKLIQAIQQEKVTNSFGSPTLWTIVADHARARGQTLPTVRRVLCAGAPVPPSLWEASRSLLPRGRLHSPYGATEALPVSSISAAEVLSETAALTRQGHGTCVGRPVPGTAVKIIALTDDPIREWTSVQEQFVGEIGEIVVSGPTVTREYDARPDATAAAKMIGPGGETWHRMGDCGYIDTAGRLWFCGRKVERVQTAAGPWYTEQVEPLFQGLPGVRRTALIGLGLPGRQEPALVLEVKQGNREAKRLLPEVARVLGAHARLRELRRVYFRDQFPVDVRHNAKIHRLTLARWAAAGAQFHLVEPRTTEERRTG